MTGCSKASPVETSTAHEAVSTVSSGYVNRADDGRIIVGISMPDQQLERWNRDGAFLKSEFEKYGFIRIHRKFIVNLKFINFVDVKIGKVYINYNGTRKSLPMGHSYRDNVEKKYTEYLRDTL